MVSIFSPPCGSSFHCSYSKQIDICAMLIMYQATFCPYKCTDGRPGSKKWLFLYIDRDFYGNHTDTTRVVSSRSRSTAPISPAKAVETVRPGAGDGVQ